MEDPDATPPAPQPQAGLKLTGGELQTRLVSGAAVALVALAMAYWGPHAFAVLTCAIAAVMSWEWGRIVRSQANDTATALHIMAVLAAVALTALGMAGLGLACVAIGAICVAVLCAGSGTAQLSGLGVIYTGLPVVALGWLRGDEPLGFLAVVFILVMVAVTDTAAYFAGRQIGGAKLWPRVSPNKTWAGLIGGVSGAALAAALFPALTGSGASLWLVPLGLVLGLVAQAGDLGESALKRHFNIKDASDLIPGHGGFMDRMDGVVTASIAAAAIALAIDAYAPARALLYGS